jgi:dihydropteroate synthase
MGVLRLGGRVFGPEQLVVMAVVAAGDATALERVHAAAAEGADAVDIGGGAGAGYLRADPGEEIRRIVPLVAAVREANPGLVIGVSTGRAEVARAACAAGADLVSGSGAGLAGVAAECGAGVVCLPGSAGRAAQMGVPPERIIVRLETVRELVGTGWPVLVSPPDREPAGSLATAALAAWLGARVFRVDQVMATRRALRMVSAIRGDIPPACAVRGLALPRADANFAKQSDCAARSRWTCRAIAPDRPAAEPTGRSWRGGLSQDGRGSGLVVLPGQRRGDLEDVVGELALCGQQLLSEVIHPVDQRLRLRQLVGVGQVHLGKGRGDGLNGRGPRLQRLHHGVLGRADQLQDLLLEITPGGVDVGHCLFLLRRLLCLL